MHITIPNIGAAVVALAIIVFLILQIRFERRRLQWLEDYHKRRAAEHIDKLRTDITEILYRRLPAVGETMTPQLRDTAINVIATEIVTRCQVLRAQR